MGKSLVSKGILEKFGMKGVPASMMAAAGHDLHGVTCHSLFKFPINVWCHKELGHDSCSRLRDILANVLYILIEEAFTVGLRSFYYMDKRLK